MVLVQRHEAFVRANFRDAARLDRRAKPRFYGAVPRDHEMRFVADEFEIVETHFVELCIQRLGEAFEMVTSTDVIKRIDEACIRGVKRFDVVQHFISAQVVRREYGEKTLGQRGHGAVVPNVPRQYRFLGGATVRITRGFTPTAVPL